MPFPEAGAPRYLLLAARLQEDIEAGRYPVGTLMPTEMEMCARHHVSRSTVREAIRKLQEVGLVSRRAGVGTRVDAATPIATYAQSGASIEELMQDAQKIKFACQVAEDVVADEALSEKLRCKPKQRFLRLEGVVRSVDAPRSQPPFYWVEMYVASAFSGVRDHLKGHVGLVANLIEDLYGESITEIRQEITAVSTPPKTARLLSVSARAPALRFQRWYTGRNDSPFQVTISIRPTERFTYSTRIRRGGSR